MKNLNLFLAGVIAGLVGLLAAKKSFKLPKFFEEGWYNDPSLQH